MREHSPYNKYISRVNNATGDCARRGLQESMRARACNNNGSYMKMLVHKIDDPFISLKM